MTARIGPGCTQLPNRLSVPQCLYSAQFTPKGAENVPKIKGTIRVNGHEGASVMIEQAQRGLWLVVSDPVRFAALSVQQVAWQGGEETGREPDQGG